MKSICLLVLVAASGLLSTLHAQINYADIPIEYRPVRNNAFSMGVRIIGGADVKFGNLGTIPSGLLSTPPDPSAGAGTRIYLDGSVQADGPRIEETDANNNQTTTPGGRYTIRAARLDAEGNQVLDPEGNPIFQVSGNFLAYTPGTTRSWSYSSEAQATSNPGFIAMHDYTASTSGATASASSGAGAGFEFTASRRLGSIGSSKIDWGFLFGFGITDINGKTSGGIRSNLTTLTDLYRLTGGAAAPTAPYTGPSSTDFIGADGTVYLQGLETTTTLDSIPFSRTRTTTTNGAEVNGVWQIKGAYYLFRAGPVIRVPLGQRFAVTFSAGYAGAYLGTKYKVEETLVVAGVSPIAFTGEDEYSKFLHGAYAEVNAEWWLTNRTGFFAGATFEKLGKYEQSLGNRTAAIDIGGNAGFRFGITTRF